MATIRDVAKMCGVSSATVSNVLNSRSAKVSPDTRQRVLAAVRKLQYKPTALEHSQRSILTRNLALVCGDLSVSPIQLNHYFGRIFDGILEAAAFQKWSVTVFVERMWSDTGYAVRRSYDGRCDGVILLAPERQSELLANLIERGVPIVTVGTTPGNPGVSSVDIDNEMACSQLTRHVIELGHQRVVYYGPNWNTVSSEERFYGYRGAMRDAGLEKELNAFVAPTPSETPVEVTEQSWRIPEVREVAPGAEAFVHRAFENPNDGPTAIVCWNEAWARETIACLHSHGIRVPADVSIAGFDDCQHSTSSEPHLTTMRQPFHQIGMRAVRILISRILDPTLPDSNVRFKAELVERESTGPRPRINSRARHARSRTFPTNGGNSHNAT